MVANDEELKQDSILIDSCIHSLPFMSFPCHLSNGSLRVSLALRSCKQFFVLSKVTRANAMTSMYRLKELPLESFSFSWGGDMAWETMGTPRIQAGIFRGNWPI